MNDTRIIACQYILCQYHNAELFGTLQNLLVFANQFISIEIVVNIEEFAWNLMFVLRVEEV